MCGGSNPPEGATQVTATVTAVVWRTMVADGVSATMGDMSADPPSTQPPAIAGQAAEAGAAPDPAALLRSPSTSGCWCSERSRVFRSLRSPTSSCTASPRCRTYVFTTLPSDLGFDDQPGWWPILPLVLSGLLVALTIRYLPGEAGHKPAEGFKTGGPVPPIELPGIILAAFFTLSLGVVLGPEAPLIAIGSGMGVLAVHLIKRDAPATAMMVIGGAGSFAAIATLLGSPLAGAFLLMEAAGLGGADDGRRPPARAGGCRRRFVDLRRARQLDRIRHVLAGDPRHPDRRLADGGAVPVGHRDRRDGGAARLRGSPGSHCSSSRSSNVAWCC